MIYGLAARTNSNIVEVLRAPDEPGRQRAIESTVAALSRSY